MPASPRSMISFQVLWQAGFWCGRKEDRGKGTLGNSANNHKARLSVNCPMKHQNTAESFVCERFKPLRCCSSVEKSTHIERRCWFQFVDWLPLQCDDDDDDDDDNEDVAWSLHFLRSFIASKIFWECPTSDIPRSWKNNELLVHARLQI